MGRKYGLSFSWKRLLGISALRGNIARATGIPTTRNGMERKLGAYVLSGCGVVFLVVIAFSVSVLIGTFTNGQKDKNRIEAERQIQQYQQSVMPDIPQQTYQPQAQQQYYPPQQTYQPPAQEQYYPQQQNYQQQQPPQNQNSAQVVYYTQSGKKYHRAGCGSIANKQVGQTTPEIARQYGLAPCERCNP